jgi:hypothetical protein
MGRELNVRYPRGKVHCWIFKFLNKNGCGALVVPKQTLGERAAWSWFVELGNKIKNLLEKFAL